MCEVTAFWWPSINREKATLREHLPGNSASGAGTRGTANPIEPLSSKQPQEVSRRRCVPHGRQIAEQDRRYHFNQSYLCLRSGHTWDCSQAAALVDTLAKCAAWIGVCTHSASSAHISGAYPALPDDPARRPIRRTSCELPVSLAVACMDNWPRRKRIVDPTELSAARDQSYTLA